MAPEPAPPDEAVARPAHVAPVAPGGVLPGGRFAKILVPLLGVGVARTAAVGAGLIATDQRHDALPGVFTIGIISSFMLVLAMRSRRGR